MSVFEKFLAGWSFRTTTPAYEPGETIEVMVTEREDGMAIARIGDSTLRIEEAPADAVDTRVLVDIETWDASERRGTGTYRETVGTSAF